MLYVLRFGFHNLEWHSPATFLMDEQEDPAVVQAIMRHAKMDMTLYYSHSAAAVENYAQRIASESVRAQAAGTTIASRELTRVGN